jgi:ribokinase
LWFESERTILIKHEAFDYVWPNIIDTPAWLYVSSLASNTESYHDDIIAYAESHPTMNVAFQPGTFQIKLGIKRLKKLYERTKVFVCNVEEARILLTDYDPKHTEKIQKASVKELLEMIKDTGPEIVLITDGPKGAYAFDGKRALFQPPYPDVQPPLERTGAGDSFASTFVVALAKGLPMETALSWAPINSMSVVQSIGAQEGLLSQKKLTEYLSSAPVDYRTKEI